VDFEELYREVILEHARRPRNLGDLPDADRHVHGDNPLCGDEVTVHVKFAANGDIAEIAFNGNACSICMASASLMTQKVKRRTRAEAGSLWQRFHDMLIAQPEPEPDETLGDLLALRGVRKFPMRVKCATLPWQALKEALDDGSH
jgi:nitrogen fixation NifU-like protein